MLKAYSFVQLINKMIKERNYMNIAYITNAYNMPLVMYLIEMIIGVILPILMLASKQSRTNLRNIFAVNFLVIIGVLVNRMNVCIFSMQDYTTSRGASYFPSAMELLLTLGIVALGIFLFKMAAKYLPLFAKA